MAIKSAGSINKIRKQVHFTHELISTSYHEAGHAIYGLLHFMIVEAVCVYENSKNKRFEGFTQYDAPDISTISDPELFQALLKSEISIKYAGLAAEKYHFKNISGSDKFPMFLRDGSSDDTLTAAELIRKYNVAPPGRKRYTYKKKLINETLHELQEHWDAVTVVAHALFKKRKLDFNDLKLLLTKKTKNKIFWKNKFKNIQYIFDNASTLDEETFKIILTY
jgi:hypothetical protein